jgi:hypothetical protein
MGEIERGEVTIMIVTAREIAEALGITLAALFMKLVQNQDGTSSSPQQYLVYSLGYRMALWRRARSKPVGEPISRLLSAF